MWIADISELSQAAPGIDWTRAFSRADEMAVRRTLNLALYLAHRMLQAPLPDDVLEKVSRDAAAQKLGDGICKKFSMSASAQLPVFARFRFRVASRDSFWAGMRFAMAAGHLADRSRSRGGAVTGGFIGDAAMVAAAAVVEAPRYSASEIE